MTPAEARSAFLWQLVTPEEIIANAHGNLEEAAKRLGVSVRTVQRMVNRSYPCPCPCCLTSVRGGGFCAWCRKSGHR